jgi:hypothetical protein
MELAAAYEDAAQITDGVLVYEGHFVRWPCYHKGEGNVHVEGPQAELARCFSAAIRARTPVDAQATLDRLIREAEARGMEMAGDACRAVADNWSCGHMPPHCDCQRDVDQWRFAEDECRILAAQHRAGEKEGNHG